MMTTYQLPLTRPGYCRLCSVIRLSVVNTDGLCDGCRDDQARALTAAKHYSQRMPPGVPRTVCSVCGNSPVTFRGRCRPCNLEDARRARLRRKAGKGLRVRA